MGGALSAPHTLAPGPCGGLAGSTWYVPADSGCGKGSTYRQIHSCTAGQAILKQAFKVGDEPVSSPIVVGGKIVVMSSTGPVVSAIAVRFTIRWR